MSLDLAALRDSLRKLAPAAIPGEAESNAPVATGVEALDRALARGGLPAGRVSEFAGAPSSGKLALALTALAHHTRAGALAAFVDGSGQLYPPAAAALGVDLSRLLVVRPRPEAASIARAIEVLARTHAFAILAADLPSGELLEHTAARRVRSAAESAHAAVVVLTNVPGATVGAALRLETWSEAPGRVAVRVGKGARVPGERVVITLARHRAGPRPAPPLPPPTTRRLPGEEP